MNINVIILLVLSVFIIYEDFSNRMINVYVLLFFFLNNIMYWFINFRNYQNLILNFLFILFILFVLKFYTFLTKKPITDDLIYGLGIGDILFFISLSPLFSSLDFFVFFETGLIFSLIIYFLLRKKWKEKHIPLAGLISLYLIFFFTVINFNLFYVN